MGLSRQGPSDDEARGRITVTRPETDGTGKMGAGRRRPAVARQVPLAPPAPDLVP